MSKSIRLVFTVTILLCLISPLFAIDKLSYQHFIETYVPGKISLLSSFAKRNKGATTAIAIVLASVAIFYPSLFNVPQLFNKVLGSMNSNYRFLSSTGFGNRFGGSGTSSNSRESRFAMKNGGELGGISNDGNTCFMNSVIQSLASSKQLMQFIDRNINSETQLMVDANVPVSRMSQLRTNLVFTRALKKILNDVNGAYGSRGKEFSTRPLLHKMPNGPKQNFFTGYNQEDAQEFYQLVMRIVEKEYKSISTSREATPEPESEGEQKDDSKKYVDARLLSNLTFGCEKLGKLGNVFVPAHQVDPNIPDSEGKVLPLELVTPVDGVSAERIGCLTCGEVGGIRYSVLSGLSLNLPYNASNYSNFTLHQLLNEWSKPEMIDEVNCNRCGLIQTKAFLSDSMNKNANERLAADFQKRIGEIDNELAKDHIADEVFERLTTKSMIRKTTKTKQALLSRPPPLLCIHINRSVFDPRTYMIVKNSKTVRFPLKLDLNPYIAEPKDINMDARLPFRKQDSSTSNGTVESPESDEDSELEEPNAEGPFSGNRDLLYNLKAVISHYGTHNYGHYICYRKYRGTWWRISDESVYVVNEGDVLNSQGTFMLFYEWDDGEVENLQQLEEEESEKESIVSADAEKAKANESDDDDVSVSSSDEDDDSNVMDEVKITKSNSNASATSEGPVEAVKPTEEVHPLQDEYRLGEERAFHV
ncbi:hypothetical protein FT663_04798 [Candidozyma haemuli var. vulneris]|nr:hypothetical protein FT662_04557 [[Candida] haemuloni var. vulneris]KAF3986636.1 hypothetical protein FT663_04798 [[Candida] haemuloni var. vulneris]